MIATIYNQARELLVQTISLTKNVDNSGDMWMFYCPYCSYQIVQIQGLVSRIMPGLEPTDMVVVLNKCPRCGMRYTFQQFSTKTGMTKVTLTRYENKENIFHCYNCRSPLLHFNHDDIYLLPVTKKVTPPISIICPKVLTCPAKYLVCDII